MAFWKKNTSKDETVSITAGGFSLGSPIDSEVKLITPANRDASPANRDLLQPRAEVRSGIPCVLGKGRVLSGRLFFTKPVRLDGSFRGEIFSSSEVVISEGAEASGKIEADKLTVKGSIHKGQVHVVDLLEAKPGSLLEGKFLAKRAKVADGCAIIGGLKVGE